MEKDGHHDDDESVVTIEFVEYRSPAVSVQLKFFSIPIDLHRKENNADIVICEKGEHSIAYLSFAQIHPHRRHRIDFGVVLWQSHAHVVELQYIDYENRCQAVSHHHEKM